MRFGHGRRNQVGGRSTWLPYLRKRRRLSESAAFGGSPISMVNLTPKLQKLDAIMIYGATEFYAELLDQCSQSGVASCRTPTKPSKALRALPGSRIAAPDLLTAQIIHRENAIKREAHRPHPAPQNRRYGRFDLTDAIFTKFQKERRSQRYVLCCHCARTKAGAGYMNRRALRFL